MAFAAGGTFLRNAMGRNPSGFGQLPFRTSQVTPQSPAQPEDAASLKARYGTMPETIEQWHVMNGYTQPGAPQPTPQRPPVAFEPPRPAPGSPSAPQPSMPGGVAPGGSASGGGDIEAAINRAWDLQTQLAHAAVGKQSLAQGVGAGYSKADPAAQAIHSELLAPVTQNLGAGRAADIASAMQAQLARAADEKRFAADAEQRRLDNEYRQRQFDASQAQLASQNQRNSQLDELERKRAELEQQRWTMQNNEMQRQLSEAANPSGVVGGLGPMPTRPETPSFWEMHQRSVENQEALRAQLNASMPPPSPAGGIGAYAGSISAGTPMGQSMLTNPQRPTDPPRTYPGPAGNPNPQGGAAPTAGGIAGNVGGAGAAARGGLGGIVGNVAGAGAAARGPNPTLGSTLYRPPSR